VEEPNEIVGEVTVTSPAHSACSKGSGGSGYAHARLEVWLDGIEVAAQSFIASDTETTAADPLELSAANPIEKNGWLAEPTTTTSHTFTIRARDDCGTEGGSAESHFKINSVAIDVIGLK
jgi:hypothetical protein